MAKEEEITINDLKLLYPVLENVLNDLEEISKKTRLRVDCYIGDEDIVGIESVIILVDIMNCRDGYNQCKELEDYTNDRDIVVAPYSYYKMFILYFENQEYGEENE